MLTRGNHKLGHDRIWSFSLPSGTPETCPGMTATCGSHCYAIALERYRPTAAAKYRRNLALSRRRDFGRRVRAFLIAHAVQVVRIHVGGDFYSARYARVWLRIIQRSPEVRFFFYTRTWVVSAIKPVIDEIAELPNCRVWYSADVDTGVPTDVPPQVRVAWLATTSDDPPPVDSHLVFRIRRIRATLPEPRTVPVCPAEDGITRTRRPTCERCGHCWQPLPSSRRPLPVIELNPNPTP